MAKRDNLMAIAQEIDGHLRLLRQALRKPMDAEIARGGLTAPQVAVMEALVKRDGMSLKELSNEVGLAHSTVSGIVDRLEKRGIVERKPDRTDGRFSRIVASKAVDDYMGNTMPSLRLQPLVQALESLKVGDRKTIVASLRLLSQKLSTLG